MNAVSFPIGQRVEFRASETGEPELGTVAEDWSGKEYIITLDAGGSVQAFWTELTKVA